MKIPERGKPVECTFGDGSRGIRYSLGEERDRSLLVSLYSDGSELREQIHGNWREVEIVPVAPAAGTLVYVWDEDKRPTSPAVAYSNGLFISGQLQIYHFHTRVKPMASYKHWEEVV